MSANGQGDNVVELVILHLGLESGRLDADAPLVRVEDASRALPYTDKLHTPEAITGMLNPENKNPAFLGRDFLGALGAIYAPLVVPRIATSPISPPMVPIPSSFNAVQQVAASTPETVNTPVR